MSNKENTKNILIAGICGCPGTALGRIIIWTKEAEKELKCGDIIVLLDASNAIPVWAIRISGGVVSCAHTSYSHLVSAATFLNKPCIVGAKFSCAPTDSEIAFINTYESVFCIMKNNKISDDLLFREKEIEWYKNISKTVCDTISAEDGKILAHIVTLDNLQSYASFIEGIFLDSTIFQDNLHNIPLLTDSILHTVLNYPNIQILYRFSKNLIDNNGELTKEIEFVRTLRDQGIRVSLFFPNGTAYNDIRRFKDKVLEIFSDSEIQIGAMIECYQILNDIESIAADKLLDFAVVGINDFMSSCLGLDRDNPINQNMFSLDNDRVNQGLNRIWHSFESVGIPCYIGYPKFNRFLEDFEILKNIGYKYYFGSPSLFSITQKYRIN